MEMKFAMAKATAIIIVYIVNEIIVAFLLSFLRGTCRDHNDPQILEPNNTNQNYFQTGPFFFFGKCISWHNQPFLLFLIRFFH